MTLRLSDPETSDLLRPSGDGRLRLDGVIDGRWIIATTVRSHGCGKVPYR